MRRLPFVPLALLVACGDSSTTTADGSASESGTVTTTQAPTGGPTSSSSSGSSTDGSGGLTGGGSSSGTATSTTTTTGDESSTTSPVLTTAAPDTTTTTGPDATTSTGPDASTSDTSGTSTTDGTTGDEPCACPDLEVPLDDGIFVLSDTAELWKYFPEFNQFTLLGEIGCDIPPPTFSMAVDRLGYAWVEYPSGALRRVDVADVTDCTDPGYVAGQQGVQNFGMAFVSNSAFDACDRIFGNEYTGFPTSDFFSIDPVTLKLLPIGSTPSWIAEVTGTGDGRAFLFTVTNPVALVEIDKNDGSIVSNTPLPGVEIGSGLAFAFFAGDFYFFTDSEFDDTSEVTHMDYDDSDMNGQQDLTEVLSDAPLRILGAGVSTCAPTLPQ